MEKSLHAFIDGLAFPVFIFAESEWERVQIHYLCEGMRHRPYTTEDLCLWAVSHGLEYRVFVTRRDMLNPVKRRYCKRIREKAEKERAGRG